MDHQPLLAVELDAAGSIAVDLGCLSCGYNLRGLAPGGRCPECGVAIGRSAHGDLLRFCSPRWLRTITRGINLLILGLVLCLLYSIFMAGFFRPWWLDPPAGLAIKSLCNLLCWTGASYFTKADPAQIDPHRNLWLRRSARYGPLAVWLADLLSYALFSAFGPGFSGTTGSIMLAASATAAAVFLVLIPVLLYARVLVQRVPDKSLDRRLHASIVILGIVGGVCVLLVISDGARRFLFLAGVALILVLVIPRVGVLRVLSRAAMRFLEAASQAEKSWAAEPTAGDSSNSSSRIR